jgi:hypothetical protein
MTCSSEGSYKTRVKCGLSTPNCGGQTQHGRQILPPTPPPLLLTISTNGWQACMACAPAASADALAAWYRRAAAESSSGSIASCSNSCTLHTSTEVMWEWHPSWLRYLKQRQNSILGRWPGGGWRGGGGAYKGSMSSHSASARTCNQRSYGAQFAVRTEYEPLQTSAWSKRRCWG